MLIQTVCLLFYLHPSNIDISVAFWDVNITGRPAALAVLLHWPCGPNIITMCAEYDFDTYVLGPEISLHLHATATALPCC